MTRLVRPGGARRHAGRRDRQAERRPPSRRCRTRTSSSACVHGRRRAKGVITPAQHAAEIKKEFDKMKTLVKVQNIKLEQ